MNIAFLYFNASNGICQGNLLEKEMAPAPNQGEVLINYGVVDSPEEDVPGILGMEICTISMVNQDYEILVGEVCNTAIL